MTKSARTLLCHQFHAPLITFSPRFLAHHKVFPHRPIGVFRSKRPVLMVRTLAMASSPVQQPFLARFYDPNIEAKDSRGRTLESILKWDNDQLEYHHDYIQLLFPLPEGSPFNPSAPIIDRVTFNVFRASKDLQHQLRCSLERMLQFYGFESSHNLIHKDDSLDFKIIEAKNFAHASRNWVKRFNHNHLRITRILRSLRVLGLENEAREFFKALRKVYEDTGKISEKSLMFWTRAVERPLYLAPEDDEDKGKGTDFLYEFERRNAGPNGESEGSNRGDGALKEGTEPALDQETKAEPVSKDDV